MGLDFLKRLLGQPTRAFRPSVVGSKGEAKQRQEHQRGIDLDLELRSIFSDPLYRPPVLPDVALELIALFRRPDANMREVLETLEKDPLLASQVLRRAQRPEFARRLPPRSLEDAARRLGLKALTALTWEAALDARVFRSPGYGEAMELLKRHSLAVAQVARRVGQHVRVEPEHVYLVGLLHDVGAAATLVALGDRPAYRRPALPVVLDSLSRIHEPASGLVADLWGLPERVSLAVGDHHSAATPVSAVVAVADALATEAGAYAPFDRLDLEPFRDACRMLRLGEVELRQLRQEAEELVHGAITLAA